MDSRLNIKNIGSKLTFKYWAHIFNIPKLLVFYKQKLANLSQQAVWHNL